MEYDIKGKTAIVTGSTRGLGLAIVEKLVSEDYDIRTDDLKANEILQKIRQLSEKDKTIVNNIIDSFKK